jgi:beta-glucanase (GH16 family)
MMNRKKLIISLTALILLFSGNLKSFSQCYELVWSDEFNYTGFPDSKIWNMEVGNNGGANNEKEWYTQNDSDNCYVDSGRMFIRALKENMGGQAYTSARINTKGKVNFMYGKVEARLKLPYGKGIWPAFWLLGANISQVSWPKCGEMDIMEMIGGTGANDRTTYGTNHWANAAGTHAYQGGSKLLSSGKFADAYHIFSYIWDKSKAYWYLDGVLFYSMNITSAEMSEFHQNYFIILNLAVGGDWPGNPDGTTVFPQRFEVDYVRVYKLADPLEMQGKDSVVAYEKSLKYNLKAIEGRTFQWTVPEGATFLSRADSNAVVVDWGCSTGEVACTVVAPCTTYIFKKNVKVIDPVIEGPVFYNKTAGNLFFSVPVMKETEYQWTIPADAAFIAGETSNAAEVTWGTIPGIVGLSLSNTCSSWDLSKKIYTYGKYPYPDPETPFSIPGTINSTNYDFGGEGVSYHDTGPGNSGTTGPREDERVDTETQPLFPVVINVSAGEWLEYTIAVPESGYYRVDLKIATANTSVMGPVRILVNGEARTTDIQVITTGSWTTYKTISQRLLYLNQTDTIMRIQAVGGGFYLGPITLSHDNSLGVKDPNVDKGQIEIYPNPVKGILSVNLQLSKPGEVNIRVLDITGKLVFSVVSRCSYAGEQQITLSDEIKNLRSGMYLIEIGTPDQKYYSKFLKD